MASEVGGTAVAIMLNSTVTSYNEI